MVKYILIALLFVSFSVIAEYEYTKPLYILLDKDKNPVQNVTKSVDDSRCLHKASKQPPGTYYCRQPDITIIITNQTEQTIISWTAPTENTDNTTITDLAGFNVYYGTSENDLSTTIQVTETQLNIKNLAPNTYYFAVTAINSIGVESELSNIVTKEVK